MLEVQTVAKTRSVPLRLVSFSVDPEYDTPDVLRRYAEDHGADPKTWTFVTGNFDAIRTTIEKGFKIAVEGRAKADAPDYGILHGSHLVLVDRNLTIRGYYSTSGEDEMGQLLADAERLARR
jgi:protein SCO1/2